MPNIDRTPDSAKRMADHAASLDALVRGSAPPPPYQPYPGGAVDHGLVDEIGQDEVQRILSEAFAHG